MKMELRKIIHRLNKLALLHRLQIHKAANANGLYFGQPPILETIKEHNNCTQKQLADILQVSPPSIATSIKRLQKQEFVQKIVDEDDLRCTHIVITEKGMKCCEKFKKSFDEVDRQMFKGFSETECEEFYNYIERLITNLSIDEEYKNQTFFSLIEKEKNLHKLHEEEEKDD